MSFFCCGSGLSEDQRQALAESTALDRVLSEAVQEEQKIIKLLLLGTGESGKSTIFKQMQILYQSGFSEFEKATFRHVIRRNIVESMQTLIQGIAKFRLQLSPEAERAARFVVSVDSLAADFWASELIGAVAALWNPREAAVITAYKMRSRLQLLDSAAYLFDNCARIGAPDYSPTPQDILRARLRTSGIVERLIPINGVQFKFIDVGGQRNERRKWIHAFQDVTAVIFVSAISEYDQVLYEDEKENRLMESIRVFESVCNNKYFADTAMILFLNKIDLFEQKIRQIPLRTCFPSYAGADTAVAASQFIRDQFLAQNKMNKLIFSHITCATDTDNVQRVFASVKVVILDENIRKMGLH